MSSTNRGGKREVSDYYATPIEDIQRFLRAWAADFSKAGLPFVESILDPCAGGVKDKEPMAYPTAIHGVRHLFPNLKHINTVDIRGDSPADIHCDYRMLAIEPKPCLIISNPPFCFAQEFVEKALQDVREGGVVVMLLRLNFLGSIKRLNFWQRWMPTNIYVHSERMKFIKDSNKTDSIEYMHAVWMKNLRPLSSALRVI